MTFDEIVTEVADRLSITAATDITRLGRAVNRRYKEVTSSLGIKHTTRISSIAAVAVPGVSAITVSASEKIVALFDTTFTPYRRLEEVPLVEIQDGTPYPESDTPTKWAQTRLSSDSVQIVLNVTPQSAFVLTANAYATVATLATTDEPAFPESFHDILIWGVLSDEYRKIEKLSLAKDADQQFEKRMSELRLWNLTTTYDVYQSRAASKKSLINSGTSGGSSGAGTNSYTQTGLITFDRDPLAPFAVTMGSPFVPNLQTAYNHIFTTAVGTQNDWAPTGIVPGMNFIHWNGATDIDVTGIATGSAEPGQILVIRNASSTGKVMRFTSNSGSSANGNKLINPVTSAPMPIASGGTITYIHYTAQWVLMSHDQGTWITPTYSAASFGASGGMTWTVEAADITTCSYRLANKTLTVSFTIINSSITAPLSNTLLISNTAYGGFTATNTVMNSIGYLNNGTVSSGYIQASASALAIIKSDTTNYTASTNLTYAWGQIVFEVT